MQQIALQSKTSSAQLEAVGHRRYLSEIEYVVIDTETTGTDAANDRVVEVAAVRFKCGKSTDRFAALINPGRPVPPLASAVHHLTDKHLSTAPRLEEIEPELLKFVGDRPIVAHNASFDRSFLPILRNHEWTCTMRLAQHLWPDAPAFKNNVLRYWLRIENEELDGAIPHRAISDAIVTGHLFYRQLRVFGGRNPEASLDQLQRYVRSVVPVERIRFGKYRGDKISDIPTSYLRWILSDADQSSDMRKAKTDPDTLAAVTAEVLTREAAASP